ncbi:hypothetical protein HWV62_25116 [Athelia sp. TMB]|nr:hypothetical protein HWV62_33427 [Athelia sp. TMB]KAF7982878.1 hypothetical protein HWV62_25116 [Athelia sp. TMB]
MTFKPFIPNAVLPSGKSLISESEHQALAACMLPAKVSYKGIVHNQGGETRLRISNGGAGQAGLIEALAGAFIDWSCENLKNIVSRDYTIDWITSDTTESIKYLQTDDADLAITYNKAAETQAVKLGIAIRKEYIFRDHFYLVGPKTENPAQLDSQNDNLIDMLNKIATSGDSGERRNGIQTRFLTRFDKSATNIRESLLFAQIGQIPWAHNYSRWYHQFPVYPSEALEAASRLREYTLTDRGTFLTLHSDHPELTDTLSVFKQGGDDDDDDPLLNAATLLLGARVHEENKDLATEFFNWMIRDDGGQYIIKNFKKKGCDDPLYTVAPQASDKPYVIGSGVKVTYR